MGEANMHRNENSEEDTAAVFTLNIFIFTLYCNISYY